MKKKNSMLKEEELDNLMSELGSNETSMSLSMLLLSSYMIKSNLEKMGLGSSYDINISLSTLKGEEPYYEDDKTYYNEDLLIMSEKREDLMRMRMIQDKTIKHRYESVNHKWRFTFKIINLYQEKINNDYINSLENNKDE